MILTGFVPYRIKIILNYCCRTAILRIPTSLPFILPSEFTSLARSLSAVSFAEEARLSAAPEDICSKARALGIEDCRIVDDLAELLNKISAGEKTAEDLPTVIAGSLYLAGEVLEILEKPEHVLEL